MSEEHARAHDSYLAAYRRTGVRKIIGIGREVVGRRRDGTIFPLDLAVAEWRDAEGKRFFTGMIHDITERKQAEAQLRSFIDEAPAPSPCSIGTCAIWPPAAAGSRTMGLTPTRCSAVRTREVFPEIPQFVATGASCALAGETIRTAEDRFERVGAPPTG